MKVYIAMSGDNYYPAAESDIIGVYSSREAAWEAIAKRERSADWKHVLECDVVERADDKAGWVLV